MPKLIIRKQRGQAQYYTEELGSDFTLDMMQIPSGTFMMGTSDLEIERLCKEYGEDYFKRESPQHEVTVPSFFMGKYPVTQAQWKAIAELDPVDKKLKPDPSSFTSNFKDADGEQDRWTRPVEKVSWEDAVEFCKRLSRETKREYRLPSEAEWEYACRAGTTTPFHFGETITTDLANYRGTDWDISGKVYPGNYGKGPKGIYREETTPVGYFKVANAFGLYDMHGNVYEWCEDDYHSNYKGAPTDGTAWIDAQNSKPDNMLNSQENKENQSYKVFRGGSWIIVPFSCRCADRGTDHPRGLNDYDVGFRVVRSSPRT
ncbi:formylglycine-generating enzyme family protein [Crocosphaera sp. XPORK-15E]|uniref:formylglycine-generating enzyme family protein n=1 Tax=Crocosphaera sp. XPORK-15E TaxID=3110247 RepID=UPI002B22173A|nr:formylglycine-generating enzyme family protein [Crocosphaera sp. XPORK-15E]MEA5536839.1 formylglycine-generating enzyme family protein [Crocosphaera sp. XPORK-15E]